MKKNQIVSEQGSTMSHGSSVSRYSKTMQVHVGGPVNMLSTNKDSSMIVVCGRNVLKLFSVEETCFNEKINMRVGRRPGLSLSCADVAWNHVNENIIATAATNGHIIIWDLNLPARNKQMTEFVDHNRYVNCIDFHNSEPGRLLSGSQDCTMKMFDIRKMSCVASFADAHDGVRSVQFCPHEYFQFAASFDNGSVQLWDYRNTSTYLTQFIAHKGCVYSLEWHPDHKEKNRIATGGRDSKIKVWEMNDHAMYEHVVIPTHSSVAMARWRPNRSNQIASVAIMLDHSINVWDLRRPFVPFAHFTEHTDVTKGIVWKNGDPEVLFSCSKDGTLYQHTMKDAERPGEHCNLSGLAVSCRGYLGYASTDNTPYVENPTTVKKHARFGFRTVVGVGNQLRLDVTSSLQTMTHPSVNAKLAKFLNSSSDFAVHLTKVKPDKLQKPDKQHADKLYPMYFVKTAKRYKLHGMPFADLCDHNAGVADQLGMFRDKCVWLYIKVLFHGAICKKQERSNSNSFHTGSLEKHTSKPGRDLQKNGAMTTESNFEDSDQHSDAETEHYLTDIARGNATSEQDCYYSEVEDMLDTEAFSSNMITSDGDGFMYTNWLPTEAIQRRLVYQNNELENIADPNTCVEDDRLITASPITIPNGKYVASSFERAEQSKKSNKKSMSSKTAAQSPPPPSSSPTSPVVHLYPTESPYLPLSEKAELLKDVLEDVLNNDNGIQIVTCAILILCHYCPTLQLPISDERIEHLQSTYLNLVTKFELWNHFAEILKLSNLLSIRSLNSACVIHSNCSLCGKRLSFSGRWICPKHQDPDHRQVGLGSGVKCALCHTVIKGLYTWCQGCGHGGHTQCMEEWFEFPHSKGRCPTGCGHVCTRCL